MTRLSIYHLRCNSCHTSYVAVPGDLLGVCFTCDQVNWQLVEIWTRNRTPWVDAPYDYPRLFPVYSPAGFLERLPHSMARARDDFVPGTCFAAPGLSRTLTRIHTPQCQWDGGLCDEECRDAVSYAPVAITAN